jgi:Fe2+ transport system protein B
MTIFLSILIVYGITNIIVHGTIFSGLKNKLKRFLSRLEDSTVAQLSDLVNYQKYNLNPEIVKAFEQAQTELTSMASDHEVERFNSTRQDMLDEILKHKRKGIKVKILYVLTKFDELINCMMCTGFWIGLFFSILSCLVDINLFGYTIMISSSPISIFLSACLFSGCCWAIDSVVDLLTDLKDKINAG